jgi:hypothetical protein
MPPDLEYLNDNLRRAVEAVEETAAGLGTAFGVSRSEPGAVTIGPSTRTGG